MFVPLLSPSSVPPFQSLFNNSALATFNVSADLAFKSDAAKSPTPTPKPIAVTSLPHTPKAKFNTRAPDAAERATWLQRMIMTLNADPFLLPAICEICQPT